MAVIDAEVHCNGEEILSVVSGHSRYAKATTKNLIMSRTVIVAVVVVVGTGDRMRRRRDLSVCLSVYM